MYGIRHTSFSTGNWKLSDADGCKRDNFNMSASTEAEIIAVTQRLLNAISAGDYDTYKVR